MSDSIRSCASRLVWMLLLSAPLVSSAEQPADVAPESIALPAKIPIFPLQDVMLFPHVPRPLHIFEPRYREMMLQALIGDRVIGMVMLEAGHELDYYGQPPIYAIGCAGVIAKVEELPDGRYNIVLLGLTKFRINREELRGNVRFAEVEAISEELSEDERDALRRHRPRLMEIVARDMPATPQPTPDELPDEELVNGLAQYLSMEPTDRLDLLQRDGALERAEALLELVGRRPPKP